MNYKLNVDKSNGIVSVIETMTNSTIKTFFEQKDAKEFLRHLNLGGGFDGFTPSFILKKVYPFDQNTVLPV